MMGEMEVEQIQRKGKNGSKRALYISDNFFFSHVQFNTLLANILSEKYKVDMLVYTDTEGITIESDNFQIISVPINEELFLRFKVENIVKYRNSVLYSTMGIYAGEIQK
uniref:Uncharacterized protein n=1 Tax=Meloidogyne enterolobii TaxID=390850 RepID=A0A6V7YB02_MELEN|nr:unnamed protein product [Meloidogyne enterolobii]